MGLNNDNRIGILAVRELTANTPYEEVPDEDLWQDGELSSEDVKNIMYLQVVQQGEWILLRRRTDV
jgi:hypothetical protein